MFYDEKGAFPLLLRWHRHRKQQAISVFSLMRQPCFMARFLSTPIKLKPTTFIVRNKIKITYNIDFPLQYAKSHSLIKENGFFKNQLFIKFDFAAVANSANAFSSVTSKISKHFAVYFDTSKL